MPPSVKIQGLPPRQNPVSLSTLPSFSLSQRLPFQQCASYAGMVKHGKGWRIALAPNSAPSYLFWLVGWQKYCAWVFIIINNRKYNHSKLPLLHRARWANRMPPLAYCFRYSLLGRWASSTFANTYGRTTAPVAVKHTTTATFTAK